MQNKLPPIYFYIPQSDWPSSGLPENADSYWQGFGRGVYCWTLQTYLRLKASGFPCNLVGDMPDEGIVLAHRDSLPENLPPPGPKLLIVCLKAERNPHPHAQLHVVQNPQEKFTHVMSCWDSYYMPHWPQPGLIPRNSTRRERFENVAFFGHERNLAPELKQPSWYEQLNALGLRWHVVSQERWNDYSEFDTVLAVRSFDRRKHITKPATKLFNAWHAGIPVIGGGDSAFQAERKSELDYLEVTSIADTISALKHLRDRCGLRQAMVENGRIRAEETQTARLVNQWRNLIVDLAVPAYESWCVASSWTRTTLLMRRHLALKGYRMQQRVLSLTSGDRETTRGSSIASAAPNPHLPLTDRYPEVVEAG